MTQERKPSCDASHPSYRAPPPRHISTQPSCPSGSRGRGLRAICSKTLATNSQQRYQLADLLERRGDHASALNLLQQAPVSGLTLLEALRLELLGERERAGQNYEQLELDMTNWGALRRWRCQQ